MLVPVERLALERAPDFEAAEVMFEKMLGGNLPGFVLRAAYVSRLLVAEQFTPILEDYGFVFAEPDIQLRDGTFQSEPAAETGRAIRQVKLRDDAGRDFELHLDEKPQAYGPLVTAINFHLTTAGRLRAIFLEPSLALIALGVQAFPSNTTEELLLRGRVDTDILQPTQYETEVGTGDLIVFRSRGQKPLAHCFSTTEYPRESYVLQAINGNEPAGVK